MSKYLVMSSMFLDFTFELLQEMISFLSLVLRI
jgi:hypothetical protein